jgi:hypothetical protein
LERASSFQKSAPDISSSRTPILSDFLATSKITSQFLEFSLDHPDLFTELFDHPYHLYIK